MNYIINRKRVNCSRVIGNERIRRYEEGRRVRETRVEEERERREKGEGEKKVRENDREV